MCLMPLQISIKATMLTLRSKEKLVASTLGQSTLLAKIHLADLLVSEISLIDQVEKLKEQALDTKHGLDDQLHLGDMWDTSFKSMFI